MENRLTDIIQNIRKHILDFLWNYRKVRVNRDTITLPLEMGGLAIMDIETQCEVIYCSILVKFIEERNQNKTWTDLMMWHLDQYRKAKQGVNIFKTYIGDTDRTPILLTYRTFLSSCSSLTDNEIPVPKTIAEIYNEPIFFNTKSDDISNLLMFLNKTPPAWAKRFFITIKDLFTVTRLGFLTADEFIKSHTLHKHIHNFGYLDYLEILKLIPNDWQNKKKQNTALPEQDTVKVMVFIQEKGKKITLRRYNANIFTELYTKER